MSIFKANATCAGQSAEVTGLMQINDAGQPFCGATDIMLSKLSASSKGHVSVTLFNPYKGAPPESPIHFNDYTAGLCNREAWIASEVAMATPSAPYGTTVHINMNTLPSPVSLHTLFNLPELASVGFYVEVSGKDPAKITFSGGLSLGEEYAFTGSGSAEAFVAPVYTCYN